MDFTNMPIGELRDLHSRIGVELNNRVKKERADAIGRIADLMKQYNLTLSDLDGSGAKERKKNGPAPVKYAHPVDKSLVWTGRGRAPKWVVDYLAQGNTKESLLIQQ